MTTIFASLVIVLALGMGWAVLTLMVAARVLGPVWAAARMDKDMDFLEAERSPDVPDTSRPGQALHPVPAPMLAGGSL